MTADDFQPPHTAYFEQPRPQSSGVKIALIIVVGVIVLCGLCGLITLVAGAVQPDRSPYTPVTPAPSVSVPVPHVRTS